MHSRRDTFQKSGHTDRQTDRQTNYALYDIDKPANGRFGLLSVVFIPINSFKKSFFGATCIMRVINPKDQV